MAKVTDKNGNSRCTKRHKKHERTQMQQKLTQKKSDIKYNHWDTKWPQKDAKQKQSEAEQDQKAQHSTIKWTSRWKNASETQNSYNICGFYVSVHCVIIQPCWAEYCAETFLLWLFPFMSCYHTEGYWLALLLFYRIIKHCVATMKVSYPLRTISQCQT